MPLPGCLSEVAHVLCRCPLCPTCVVCGVPVVRVVVVGCLLRCSHALMDVRCCCNACRSCVLLYVWLRVWYVVLLMYVLTCGGASRCGAGTSSYALCRILRLSSSSFWIRSIKEVGASELRRPGDESGFRLWGSTLVVCSSCSLTPCLPSSAMGDNSSLDPSGVKNCRCNSRCCRCFSCCRCRFCCFFDVVKSKTLERSFS